MSERFIQIYFFFRKRRLLFYLFFASLLILILFFASRIKVQENISGMAQGGRPGKLEYIVDHIKFSDKLIVRISLADTSIKADPELLILYAKDLTDSLTRRFDSSYIKGIIGNVTDSSLIASLDLLYNHLPLFLDAKDYRHIDSMLTPAFIHSAVEKDYRNLLTPAGFALKKMILRDPLGLTYMAMNKLRSLQAGSNFDVVDGFVMTKDRKSLLLFITPANPSSETARNDKLVQALDDILGKISEKYKPEIRGQYFGAIAFASANARQVKKDILLTLIIALSLIFLLIGGYFKSWKVPLLGLLPALFGGGLALAILYLVKGTVSAISLGIGSVILGLIVDYALYLITLFRRKGDMIVVLREMTLTIIVCSLTSAGAFLCLIFLRSTVLHDLGWFAALSVTGAAFFSLVILPHFLKGSDFPLEPVRRNIISRIASFSFERSIVVIILLITVLVASLFFLSKVRFEDDMMALNFLPEKLKGMEKDLDRITGASLKTIYIVYTGKDLNDALKTQERSRASLDDLTRSGIISNTSGCGDLLFSDSLQKIKIRSWNEFWTKDRKELLARELSSSAADFKFRKNAFDPFRIHINGSFSILGPSEIKIMTSGVLSDYVSETKKLVLVTNLIKVRQENKGKVYAVFNTKPGIVVFDKQVLTNNFVANVRHDFDLLVRLSMIFVTLLLLLSFGRLETGLTTALPMFASWLLTLGFMGMTGIRFNIFNIIVSSFIFGLGVDYSILMMRGLLFEYKQGTREITTYKTSIFLSSVTTLFGVGALFFALHPALKSIAMVSVFGVVAVVIVSYTFQPLPVRWFLSERLRRGLYPVTFRIFFKTFITWGNIILVVILQVVFGSLIFLLYPGSRKKKQNLFHWLFSKLCKAFIRVTFPTNQKIYNEFGEDFSKPAVIISNHQSLIETPLFLSLHPKIIILTTDCRWNSSLFGPVARMASFFNAENGMDNILVPLKEKVSEGYSILIFPEAHCFFDNRIHRFHKGAFYLAEMLQIDILPVVVFGSGESLGKGEFWGRPAGLRMKILKRIGINDASFGQNYSERSKQIRHLYIRDYESLMEKEGNGHYYRKKLVLNYVFKGPVLEWSLRVKMNRENYYQQYNELLPRKGGILELGCGYGFMSYMLSFTGPDRQITGVDYDEEKIRVAQNCFSKNENIIFLWKDIMKYDFENQDTIVLNDALYDLPQESQAELLNRCIEKLNPRGMILLKDSDSLTSMSAITQMFNSKELEVNMIRKTKHTSCLLMIIRKK